MKQITTLDLCQLAPSYIGGIIELLYEPLENFPDPQYWHYSLYRATITNIVQDGNDNRILVHLHSASEFDFHTRTWMPSEITPPFFFANDVVTKISLIWLRDEGTITFRNWNLLESLYLPGQAVPEPKTIAGMTLQQEGFVDFLARLVVSVKQSHQ